MKRKEEAAKVEKTEEEKIEMEYRFLGNSGLKVSALSYGTWVTTKQESYEEIEKCCLRSYEAGVNFFDTAEVYCMGEAETVLGKIIKKAGWNRKDIVVSTKLFQGPGRGPNDIGLSRKHIVEGTRNSLKRLQLDYVDLLFCHRPDYCTPIEETVRAMNFVINQGGVYHGVGVTLEQAKGIADRLGLIPPLMEQPQYNMFHRRRFEVEYAPLYASMKLGTTVWSPLAMGLLTGKYNDGIPKGSRFDSTDTYEWKAAITGPEHDKIVAKLQKLAEFAKTLDCSMTQLALAWCLKNENVSTVILGASKLHQIEENLQALAVYKRLDAKAMEEIEAILDNVPEHPKVWRT